MIVGSYNVTVDSQNRLIVPTLWHQDIGEFVIITRDVSDSGERFLTAMPSAAYQSTINDFGHNPATSKRYNDAARNLLQYACECRFDPKRRITVNSANLEYAGIKGTAMLTANLRSSNPVFEIWNPDALERNNKAYDEIKMREELEKNADEVRNLPPRPEQ